MELTMPGARSLIRRGNRNMVGGPALATHHITDDELHSDGTRLATLTGDSMYLADKGYEPHVVIDPFTGEAVQLLDAPSSGYALEHPAGQPQTNRQGSVNLQVEWLFTPGTVYAGRRYDRLTDTPMLGLDRFVDWCESWGVATVARLQPGDRNAAVWAMGGHVGHYNAPGNSHVDPIVPIAAILAKRRRPDPVPVPTLEELPMDFTYIAQAEGADGPEDWVFSAAAHFCGRLPFGDTLDGLKGKDGLTPGSGHPVLIDLGRRSPDFHAGVAALADQCRFAGSRY